MLKFFETGKRFGEGRTMSLLVYWVYEWSGLLFLTWGATTRVGVVSLRERRAIVP